MCQIYEKLFNYAYFYIPYCYLLQCYCLDLSYFFYIVLCFSWFVVVVLIHVSKKSGGGKSSLDISCCPGFSDAAFRGSPWYGKQIHLLWILFLCLSRFLQLRILHLCECPRRWTISFPSGFGSGNVSCNP